MLIAAEIVSSCAAAGALATRTKNTVSAKRLRSVISSSVANRRRAPSMRALLDDRERPVDQEDQHEQENGQRDRDVEVAFARLQHHRGGERPRRVLDVEIGR